MKTGILFKNIQMVICWQIKHNSTLLLLKGILTELLIVSMGNFI